MAATVYLDRIEGSQVVKDQQGIQSAVRVAIVDGIDIDPNANDPASDPFILVRALAAQGMPQTLSGHPADGTCQLVRHVIRGMANQQVRVDCIYERPSYGGTIPIGTWVLNTQTISRPMLVQRNPATLNPIKVIYKAPGATNNIVKTASMVMDVPMARLVARGQFRGLSRPDWRLSVGCVNQGTWKGLDQGFWLLDELMDDPTQVNTGDQTQNLYTYTAVFTTQIYYDWAYYAFYRLPSGDYVKIDDAQMDVVRNQTYSFVDTPYDFGVTRVEPYPLANFATIFGIPA